VKLIGLHSRASGGKDTVAAHLVERHGFVQVAFADAVYRGLATMFGVEESQLRARKEEPRAWFFGRAPRYLLQTLGTEWGRELVHPDLWVYIVKSEVERRRATNCRGVVISDVRYDNEADYVRNAGGQIWLIVRTWKLLVREHSSERGIATHGPDRGLLNDGTIEDLRARVDLLIEQLEAK
jgi:hypothetical protein